MNIEEIKEGETYNVRVKVIGKYGKCIDAIFADADDAIVGIHIPERRVGILRPISHENGIKNTENAPKYDSNRLFRKRDKVHMKPEVNGRPVYIGDDAWEPLDPNEIWSVEEDELETGWVHIKTSCVHATVWHGMLELVTPVEELEPYFVKNIIRGYAVYERGAGDLAASCVFWSKYHPNAKAAAEAERDRLNAEHRKEQQ